FSTAALAVSLAPLGAAAAPPAPADRPRWGPPTDVNLADVGAVASEAEGLAGASQMSSFCADAGNGSHATTDSCPMVRVVADTSLTCVQLSPRLAPRIAARTTVLGFGRHLDESALQR